MAAGSLLERLSGTGLARRATHVLMSQYARRRTRWLDRCPAARLQERLLLDLVRQAQETRFGREHGFAAIRTVLDYQERVPLREYEAFWREYWQPVFPTIRGATWPGPIPYYALSSGTTSGTTKYVPVSTAMLRSIRRGGMTGLALFLSTYPQVRAFDGRIFFLGGSTDMTRLDDGSFAGDMSGIGVREMLPILRPYTYPPTELALLSDWERKIQLLAERSVQQPITAITGVPSWLLVLFDRLKRVTGKQTIAEVWPMLRVVVHGGTKFDAYRAVFRKEIGSEQVHFLETYPASEAYIAVEDPRYHLLRLIPDNGVFYEFVPVDELGQDTPTRHTLANLEPGVQYAVVLTTCAGLWGYVIGDTIRFEKRDPPLLHFTGRTRYFLSAFGEHLISEEIEKAVAQAADATGAAVTDFHVGPVFPADPSQAGHHRYLIEFAQAPADLARFAAEVDAVLSRLNEDYRAHRKGGLSLGGPEVWPVRRGGFTEWMRAHGKLGGQHKLPRMDNTGTLSREIETWLHEHRAVDA